MLLKQETFLCQPTLCLLPVHVWRLVMLILPHIKGFPVLLRKAIKWHQVAKPCNILALSSPSAAIELILRCNTESHGAIQPCTGSLFL